MRAFARALDQGLIRHVGMSSHWPMLYLEAAEELPVEVVLIWGNYLDFCNFPEIPATILPKLRERGIGVLFMKPLADGFLFRSPRFALRYALAQDADCLVAGFNSVSMLEEDLHVCCDPEPVTEAEVETILREAQELGDYVCRQCPECSVTPGDGVLKRVFELEGKYDRQMDDLRPCDPAQYAMRERLKGWFQGGARAQQAYATLGQPAPRVAGGTLGTCRYGLDIQRKLRIAHAKLVASERPELL
jgi:predicted aldo/keto reductase-like oxidoreductase